MMYEGPLFRPEEFEAGAVGEGLNLSIAEFKELKEKRLQDWIKSVKLADRTSFEEIKIKDALKETYQWEDFKHHHWAFVARVLDIEINIR